MKIKDCFQERKMFGQVMMVPVGYKAPTVKGVIRLNKPGYSIWKWIEEGLTEEEIIPLLAKQYRITEDKARTDTFRLIGDLRASGVFEEEEGPSWKNMNLKDLK